VGRSAVRDVSDPRTIPLRRLHLPVIVLLFLLGCVLVSTTTGSGSSGTTLRVGSASITLGQVGRTDVVAAPTGGDTVNAFDISVSFDPSVVTVAGVTMATGWTSPALAATIDNAAGSIRIASFQLGVGCVTDTPCPLFSVSWLPLKVGSTTLHVTSQQIAGSNAGAAGLVLGVVPLDGSVTVIPVTTPTPTPWLPTATQTPRGKPTPTATRTMNCPTNRKNPHCGP
jgi:hypothetical protein